MKRKTIVGVIFGILAVAVFALLAFTVNNGDAESTSRYSATFMSLLPPVIAIGLALITKEVYSSLFIGIVAGGLLSTNFRPVAAMDNILNEGLIAAVSGTAGIFIFLVVLGIFVALINKAGGSAAFGKWAQKHIKSKTGASMATFILGVLIFIDDYLTALPLGRLCDRLQTATKFQEQSLHI